MFEKLKEKLAGLDYEKSVKSFFAKCRWFNIQLTTAFGIVTTIHWSVPAFLLLLLFVDPLQAGIAAMAFLSVVPHEYGHALAARWFGIKTKAIVLYPLGGVAMLIPNKEIKLERWREFVVAAAGPAVSLGLALLGLIMSLAATRPNPAHFTVQDINFWFWLFVVNAVMFLFNMIPAFPMDGGRMLRAVINLFVGHVRSTQYAYYCSFVFCFLIGTLGIIKGYFSLTITMMVVHILGGLEYANVKRQAAQEEKT